MDITMHSGRNRADRLTELILDGMAGQQVNVLVYDYGDASQPASDKKPPYLDSAHPPVTPEREALCAEIDAIDSAGKSDVPPEFKCPITLVAMRDPVVACDGHTYERSALMEAFRKEHSVSPMTRQPISNSFVYPNYALVSLMSRWVQRQGTPKTK